MIKEYVKESAPPIIPISGLFGICNITGMSGTADSTNNTKEITQTIFQNFLLIVLVLYCL